MSKNSFYPIEALQMHGRHLLTGFALLLLLTSLWGMLNMLDYWNRSVDFVKGIPGEVREQRQDGEIRYLLPFTVDENGQQLELKLLNNGPALAYFMEEQPKQPLAILYWSHDMSVAEVHPLVAGQKAIRDRYPSYGVLLGSSVLGILLAVILLLGGRLEKALYSLIRH